ncbi:MAG: hypothetical protein ACJAWL_001285 [Motiliproteus sp.]|jgi:uncharacterized protein with beta-barrel porin domain
MKTVFKRKTLHIAMSAALLSLTSLPSLVQADPLATYSLGGVDGAPGATSLSLTSGSAVNNLVILQDMTMVNNAGTIETTDPANAALVINLGASVTTLTNTGTIQNHHTDAGSTQIALYVAGDIVAGTSIINEGIISASGESSSVTVRGIYVSADVAGTVTNNGDVIVRAITTDSDAQAIGIYASSVSGAINNNGDIIVEAESSNSSVDAATGIYVNSGVSQSGSIINSGLISVDISADSEGEGAGIYVGGDMAGELRNEGFITLTSTVDFTSQTSFFGISVDTLSGTLTNTSAGTIEVSHAAIGADTEASHSGVVGIDIGTLTGTLDNQGSIEVTGSGTDGWVYAYGMSVGTLEGTGEINNSGDIVVAGESNVRAYGVDIGTLDGQFNNSGTIVATGISNAKAYGVKISSLDGGFNNSGTIRAIDEREYDLAIGIYGGTGDFNNLYGGLIEGDIDIGGGVAVTNAGTLFLPSIHQGEIAGDYSQTATGTLRIGAVSDILYGSLVVGGTANFAEGTTIDVDVAGINSLDVDSELLAVISAGVLEATTFTVTDNSALLNFSALIDLDADTVALQAEKGQTIVEAIRIAGKPSTQGAAAVFDTAPSGLAAATAELNLLATEQEVANAVETTVPGITGGVAQLTGFTSAAVTRVVASRQASARGLASGDGFLTDRHLWFKPFGSWTDQDERQGVTGYDINSYGLAFGADGDISSMWNVGFALAYINSAVESNLSAGRHDIAMDTYEAKVYATASLDEVTAVNLQAGVGASAYDSRRLVYTGDVAAAKYDSWNAQLSAALERSFQSGEKTLLTPYVHADYSYVDVESYTETGAGALNLNVAADNAASLIFGAGVKTNHAVSDELVLMADAGVGYDVLTESSNLTSSFTGGGANFTTAGIKPDEWVYNASVGAAYNLENGTEVSANYTLNAREDYTDQAVSVNVRTLF